jgi:hypothetical protein
MAKRLLDSNKLYPFFVRNAVVRLRRRATTPRLGREN